MAKEERDFVNPKQLLRAISKAMPKLAAELRDALIGLYAHSEGYIPQKLVDAGKFRFRGTVSYSQLDEFSGCGEGTSKQRMERLKDKGLVDWQRTRYGVSFLVQLGYPNPVSLSEGADTLSADSSEGTDATSEGMQDSSQGMQQSSQGMAVPYSGLSGIGSGSSGGSSGVSPPATSASQRHTQTSGTASLKPAQEHKPSCVLGEACKAFGRDCSYHGQGAVLPCDPAQTGDDRRETLRTSPETVTVAQAMATHQWVEKKNETKTWRACTACSISEGPVKSHAIVCIYWKGPLPEAEEVAHAA